MLHRRKAYSDEWIVIYQSKIPIAAEIGTKKATMPTLLRLRRMQSAFALPQAVEERSELLRNYYVKRLRLTTSSLISLT
ncbi:MAG: hypothetical protein ABI656_06065 [bacterium]